MQTCEKAYSINGSTHLCRFHLCQTHLMCWHCEHSLWMRNTQAVSQTYPESITSPLVNGQQTPEEWCAEQTLTVNEFSCIEQEVGHEDPVDHHRTNQWHQRENQTGPFSESPKVIFTHIGKLPVWGVYIRCNDRTPVKHLLLWCIGGNIIECRVTQISIP